MIGSQRRTAVVRRSVRPPSKRSTSVLPIDDTTPTVATVGAGRAPGRSATGRLLVSRTGAGTSKCSDGEAEVELRYYSLLAVRPSELR